MDLLDKSREEKILANEHVLANVLVRLPLDSLCRFKCVSKSWRDFISCSYFKDMHSTRTFTPNIETHRHSKIIASVGSEVYKFDSIVKNGEKLYTATAKRLRSPNMKYKHYGLELDESCNGIVFLSNPWTGGLVLWNPFTGSTLNCWKLTSPPYEFTRACWEFIQTAFGYDHLNDDYKLVKWYLNDAPRFAGKGFDLFELCVYSFKHKSWTTITDARELGLFADGGYLPNDCTFANGAMHWLMQNNLILAFDLGTYKFHTIPCAPIPKKTGRYLAKSLSSLNGCLCLGYTVSGGSAYIWVMKEYGVDSTWTKIACIDHPNDNPDIELHYMKGVAYSEKRGMLMLQRGGRFLVMYDLKTKSLSDITIDWVVKRCCVCVCVGGFVSPLDLALLQD